jgi:hypothetical protein
LLLYGLLAGWARCGGRTNQVLGKNWPGYAGCGSSQSHSPLLGFLYFFFYKEFENDDFQFVSDRKFGVIRFYGVTFYYSFSNFWMLNILTRK